MLPSLFLSSTLLFSLATVQVRAGRMHWLQPCNLAHQKLQQGTFQFQTDCDDTTYCAANSTCARRGCRSDDYPFGYPPNTTVPPKCGRGSFCPDEESRCQKLLPVGSACQFNRDDECEAPPNFKELADKTGFGLNVNGSVCLHNVCTWANVTVGRPCVVQNTAYTAYGPRGQFVHIVSRGNCKVGLYCDSRRLVCVQTKAIGDACSADKECSTFNCASDGRCGATLDTSRKVGSRVYAVGLFIVAAMGGTLAVLYYIHKQHRAMEHEKRLQYWREQNVLRENIMQMQETEQRTLVSGILGEGSPRGSTMYGRDGVQLEESGSPVLHGATKGSGLRHYVSDDASQMDDDRSLEEEDLMMHRRDPNAERC